MCALSLSCHKTGHSRIIDNALIGSGCEFCISTKKEHDWCVVFIPSHMFAPGAATVEPLPGSTGKRCRVTRPNRQAADRFQSLVGEIMTAAGNYSQFESSSAASCIAAEVLKIVSSYVSDNHNRSNPIQEGERGFRGRKSSVVPKSCWRRTTTNMFL